MTKSKIKKRKTKSKQLAVTKDKKILNIIICVGILILVISCLNFIYIIKTNMNITKFYNEISNDSQNDSTLESITPHYLFLGDSITERYDLEKYFENYSVVNSGVGGNITNDLINDLQHRVYKYNPSTIFLMIGTNDVNQNKSAKNIFENIEKIIKEIQFHLPKSRILVLSILPSSEIWNEHDNNDKRIEVNKMIKERYNTKKVQYIDLYNILKEKESNKINNSYTTDGLHLNEKGYELISKKLKEYMNTNNHN